MKHKFTLDDLEGTGVLITSLIGVIGGAIWYLSDKSYEPLILLLGSVTSLTISFVKRTKKLKEVPLLDAEFLINGIDRRLLDYSDKNPFEIRDGKKIPIIVHNSFVAFWHIKWECTLRITNNSPFPAYNISLKSVGARPFSYIQNINAVNNLQPFQHMDINVVLEDWPECSVPEVKEITVPGYPVFGKELKIAIEYQNQEREVSSLIIDLTAK